MSVLLSVCLLGLLFVPVFSVLIALLSIPILLVLAGLVVSAVLLLLRGLFLLPFRLLNLAPAAVVLLIFLLLL